MNREKMSKAGDTTLVCAIVKKISTNQGKNFKFVKIVFRGSILENDHKLYYSLRKKAIGGIRKSERNNWQTTDFCYHFIICMLNSLRKLSIQLQQ